MRKDNFTVLRELVHSMKPTELETAKRFVNAFDSNITKRRSKTLRLYKLIVKKPDISWEKAKAKVSPDIEARSFDRLVSRLTNKVLESFLLEVNNNKKDVYTDFYRNNLGLRKMIIQAYAAYSKGAKKLARAKCDLVIKKGKQFEIYNSIIEALEIKRDAEGFSRGKKFYLNQAKQIDFYRRCAHAVAKSKDWYYRHYLDSDSSGLNVDKVGLLTEAIADLQKEYRDTKSANVGYYLYALMMEYYLAVEEFYKACETGYDLIQLIQKSKAVYSKFRISAAYSDLADNELFTHNFQSSIENASKALGIMRPNTRNYAVTKEITFRSYFYLGDIAKAGEVVDELFEFPKEVVTPFMKAKWDYFKSCVLFQEGKFKETHRNLQDTKEIEKDKEGWNVGRRVLLIQTFIEMDLLDVADSSIESLRKHIERQQAYETIRDRDRIISQILIYLERKSFDFAEVYEKYQGLFEQLRSTEKDLRWEVKTPEMIVFHEWFEAKAKGLPYSVNIAETIPVPVGSELAAAKRAKKPKDQPAE